MTPKYPNITVKLTGEDGSAMTIVRRIGQAMREARVPREEIDAFRAEALSGNYDHVIQTAMAYVEVV